jgi:hypothetical protein
MPRPLLPWLANSSSQRMSGSFAKHTNATCWTLPLYERTGSGLWPRRGLRCKILLATHAHMPLPKLFSAAMTTVQLEHRKNSHKLDFPDGSRISDVRERAAQVTGLDPSQFRMISKGRELSDTVALSSLQSMLRRPIRIMLMEKTKPVLGPASDLNAPEACTGGNHATNTTSSQGATRTAQSAAEKAWNSVTPWLSRSRRSEGENPSCSATDAVDGACADLPPCAHKV